MTPLPIPAWIRVVSVILGSAALVLSGFSFFAPAVLFSDNVYQLGTRMGAGLLGSLAAGVGSAALLAGVRGDVAVLRMMVLTLFISSAFVPATVIYNIGFFNQADPTGWRAFSIAGGIILAMSFPLLLSLLVLNRLYRVGTQRVSENVP
jgi:hypothetical protein